MHIVHTESSCGWGGQEIRILTESRCLMDRGHRVTLLTPEESNIYKAAPQYGLERVALPIVRKNLSGLWAMRAWLARHRSDIDVVNTHSSTDSWLAGLACRTISHAPPIVRTRHVSSPINTKASTRWLYQTVASHIVVTGEPLRHQLAKDNGFRMESMTSVPTGIDLERFRPMDKVQCREQLGVEQAFQVGILATLRSWKGHGYLLEAAASLRAKMPELRLLIVGDGPMRQRLEQQVGEMGLMDIVRFVGNQDNPEVWLNTLDLFVLPSYGDEGVSQAVMQAMASRLPVITTAVGGMTDAVQHEETGLLVETKDASAIAGAIERCVRDKGLSQDLSDAGYQRAQVHFGRERMADRMEAIFSDAVKSDTNP